MQSENKKLKMQPYQQNRQDRTVVVFLLRNVATGRSSSNAAGRRTALRKAEVKRQVVHCVWRKWNYNTSTNTCSFLSKAFPWALFFPYSPTIYFAALFPLLTFSRRYFFQFLGLCLLYPFWVINLYVLLPLCPNTYSHHGASQNKGNPTQTSARRPPTKGKSEDLPKGKTSLVSMHALLWTVLDNWWPTWTTSGSFCSTAAFPSSSFSFGRSIHSTLMYDLHSAIDSFKHISPAYRMLLMLWHKFSAWTFAWSLVP